MHKTVSPSQLAANASNARKSTGPKTAQGREISKWNALKHGIFSKEVLVRSLRLQESPGELTALFEEFRQSLNPVGPLENMLVDQIVSALWRLRRALRAESGEIALSVNQNQARRCRSHPDWNWLYWQVSGSDPVQDMQYSAEGNSAMVLWMTEVRARVEQDGELTEAAIKIPFLGHPNGLSRNLERLRLLFSQNSDGPDAATRRQENKQQALRAIDLQLLRLERRKADCEAREAAEENARQAAAVLPRPEVVDKILRYETTLQRQMYRAMNQLERLQRMRQGESIPAPVTMEVSESV